MKKGFRDDEVVVSRPKASLNDKDPLRHDRAKPASVGHPDSGGLLRSGDRPYLHFSEGARAALTRWYQNRAKFRFPDSGSMMFSESTLTSHRKFETRKVHGVAHLMKSISGSGRPCHLM